VSIQELKLINSSLHFPSPLLGTLGDLVLFFNLFFHDYMSFKKYSKFILCLF
jgi:hypothetical protein